MVPYDTYSKHREVGRVAFWATLCKTVRLRYRTVVLSVLSVCNVGVLWPKGWMDQDETWQEGRPRPRPYCVRWGPSFPPKKEGEGTAAPTFRPIYCSQIAG